MEEDFILPEGEKVVTSNKTFLLTAVTLLTTLIVLSLGVIALFLLDRQDKLAAIPATPPLAPTVYQDIVLPGSISTTVTGTAIPAFTSTAAITEGKGSHYIVIYVNSTPSKEMTITPTAGGALQIVPYPNATDIRNINITPNNGGS